MAKGDGFSSEMREFTDPDSGKRIIQLTDNGAHNRHMYFYVPTFTAGGQTLLFISGRTGSQQYYRMDLATGESVQLTDTPSIFVGGCWYVEATRSIYFWSGAKVMRVDIDDLTEREIFEESRQGSYLTASHNGRYVAYAVREESPEADGSDQGRPGSVMAVVDVERGTREFLGRYPFQISHVLFNPADDDQVMFCWEGSWVKVPQRMWWTNRSADRGGPLGPQPPDQSRGHEFFFPTGGRAGFHGARYDRQGKMLHGIFGHLAKDGTDECLIRTDGATGHCQVFAPGDVPERIVCDVGGDTVGDGMLSLIHADWDAGTGRFEPLHSHGSSWVTQGAHPHPQFSPDGTRVVFTTDRNGKKSGTAAGKGFSNVYLLEL